MAHAQRAAACSRLLGRGSQGSPAKLLERFLSRSRPMMIRPLRWRRPDERCRACRSIEIRSAWSDATIDRAEDDVISIAQCANRIRGCSNRDSVVEGFADGATEQRGMQDSVDLERWSHAFRESVADLPRTLSGSATYQQASERLRTLVRSGLLRHTDVRDAPGEWSHACLDA